MKFSPIGIFDSGLGGLTIYKEIVHTLPVYDYLYVGDSARVPYGNRSFDTVLMYTLEAIKYMFGQGCELIIIACNTASAKALRSIQQGYLKENYPDKRVLGVIRPTTEICGLLTTTNKIGVMATEGTVKSASYLIEIEKFFPEVEVFQQACPMWVPLIENEEQDSEAADYFIEKYISSLLSQDSDIDTIILACTHYPLLYDKIKAYLPESIQLIMQGELVAKSLVDYLQKHSDLEEKLSQGGSRHFLTTDDPVTFNKKASLFLGEKTDSKKISL